MLTDVLAPAIAMFHTHAEIEPVLEQVCEQHRDIARLEHVGMSEEGRPIYAAVLGSGPRLIALSAGAHAEEPVGPETLRHFIRQSLRQRDRLNDLFKRFTLLVIPHVNPDGESRNRTWIDRWPDPRKHLLHAIRELPGRDVEFGYPDMRPENRVVADALRRYGPFDLYVNLHGMSFADGAMLLIERHWVERTGKLRADYAASLIAAGLELFDWDRGGDKGFVYIGPGFMSTPEAEAMKHHFLRSGDAEMAAKFHQSSMEFVRSLGGDPLCLVTELPLFLITRDVHGSTAGQPTTYLRWRDELPRLRLKLEKGEAVDAELDAYGIVPLDLAAAMTLQLRAIELGIEAIG